MIRTALVLIAGCVLAGCGGGGGAAGNLVVPKNVTQEPPTDYFVAMADYGTMSSALAARSNTAFVEPKIEGMPSSGRAIYDGYFHAELETTALTTRLLGLASVAVDFATDEMVGSATDFIGVDRTGAMSPYSGSVAMTGGNVGVTRPNDFSLPYSGSLDGNGETVVLSGTITGNFKGDPIRGILGTDAMTGTIDGTPFAGEVDLAATVRP